MKFVCPSVGALMERNRGRKWSVIVDAHLGLILDMVIFLTWSSPRTFWGRLLVANDTNVPGEIVLSKCQECRVRRCFGDIINDRLTSIFSFCTGSVV